LKVKDALFVFQDEEFDLRKQHDKLVAKVFLQRQKLDSAYAGFEEWREKK